jgi:hypothetical protein
VSEQVRIRETWEKEPLGFPTGLAHDRHARRMMVMREFLAFLNSSSPSSQQPFFEFSSPLFTKNSSFFSFSWLLQVVIPTPW